VIKIAHSMALKNIPYLFLPVYLVSGFRCQVSLVWNFKFLVWLIRLRRRRG